MLQKNHIEYLTSESVTEGHPDKVCDQIADAILDDILKDDPYARVACEVVATTGMIMIMGEITTTAYCDFPSVARDTIRKIGYTNNMQGFNSETCAVLSTINEQSPDIAVGVNEAIESRKGEAEKTLGAGDQGIMFGYACRDTEELMPLPIALANRICKRLAETRKSGESKTFQPDGKAQVTVRYEDGVPKFIDNVVVSTQHTEEASLEEVQREVHELVLDHVLPKEMITVETKYYINPTGRFVTGGPVGDSGLTGRKIIVDTYGGFSRHGGGAFSGKDPTKVDRSASYAARHVAKNIVASGLADSVEVRLAYAIGMAEPVSIDVDCFGTEKIPYEDIVALTRKHFDLTPQGIIDKFDLRRPIYSNVAAYGHFGREELDVPWERVDVAEILRQEAGI